jgi:hypothetical protein
MGSQGGYYFIDDFGSMPSLEPAADLFNTTRAGGQETKRGVVGGIIVWILVAAAVRS